MPKLRLDLDDLQVETFAVTRHAARDTGTVRGHAKATYACTEGWDGCPVDTIGAYTCNPTDDPTDGGMTCDNFSCNDTNCCQSFNPCDSNTCVFTDPNCQPGI